MTFVRLQRKDYLDHVFLDERLHDTDRQRITVSAPSAVPKARKALLPVHYIFHSAFCGSTLLTRALELLDNVLVVREPLVLIQLAETVRLHPGRWRGSRLDLLSDQVVSALSRGFETTEHVIIKPSNLVTGLAPRLMRNSQSRAVLMYAPLADFLVSCAKKPPETRRRLLDLPGRLAGCFGDDSVPQAAYQGAAQNYLRAGALSWLLQIRQYCRLTRAVDGDRYLVLNIDDLLDRPQQTTGAISAHFGLPRIECMAWLRRHGKVPDYQYSPDQRRSEMTRVSSMLGPALSEAIDWLQLVFGNEVDAHLQQCQVSRDHRAAS